MDRCDGRLWSDEEEFLIQTQRHVEETEAPQGGGDEDDRVYDDEFGEISWFEEETETYLGRESSGCRDKVERRGEAPSSEEDSSRRPEWILVRSH